jgi:hypothetical protein
LTQGCAAKKVAQLKMNFATHQQPNERPIQGAVVADIPHSYFAVSQIAHNSMRKAEAFHLLLLVFWFGDL